MAKSSKFMEIMFICLILLVFAAVHYIYCFRVWGPKVQDSPPVIVLLIVFNFLGFMMLWSLFQTIRNDPGRVPIYWGFYMGDPESKRKRYCLMCNVFKPDRCHHRYHCSACNRCVLNMDHHCPWVNNCIGFWNRKYFLLLLFYTLGLLYFFVFSMLHHIIQTVFYHIDCFTHPLELIDWVEFTQVVMEDVSFIFASFLGTVMTKFVWFHITLVRKNMTTIESLEHKTTEFESLYDIGEVSNCIRITAQFGAKPLLWFLPYMGRSGKPKGSGVNWPLKHGEMSIQDDRMDGEDETNKESASQKLVRGTSGIEKISQGRAPDPTNSSALLNPIVEKGAFSIKSITKPVETSSREDYSLKGNTQMNKVQVHESGKKDVFAPSLKKGQHSHKSSSNTTGGRVNLPRKQTNVLVAAVPLLITILSSNSILL